LDLKDISNIDPDIADAIAKEIDRQSNTLELIASENIASRAVMAVQGSVLTNKYAEGYPDKRYYGGCEYVDVAERLAVKRAKKLFNAAYANVQPHSGSQANMAVYFALLNPGDTVLGMALSHGGHLTHGSPVSFSGRLYNFVHYGVKKDTGRIDYEEVALLAKKHRPKMIIAGASAYPRIIDFKKFAEISELVGAYLVVDMAHIAGLVAAGVHPSPIPFADVVTSTTHKTLRGPRGGLILAKTDYGTKLNKQVFPGIQGGPMMHIIAAKAVAFKEALSEDFRTYQINVVKNANALAENLMKSGVKLISDGRAGITVNKNSIPFEKLSPFVTSGIRIGTPAITTRGMKEPEMEIIAEIIIDVLKNHNNDKVIDTARHKTGKLCNNFPIIN